MILTPKSGESIEIIPVDGLAEIVISPKSPIDNMVFLWPENPVRAEKVHIHADQDISNIAHIGADLDVELVFMSANSDIRFVYCAESAKWLCTGRNQYAPYTPRPETIPRIERKGLWSKVKKLFGGNKCKP